MIFYSVKIFNVKCSGYYASKCIEVTEKLINVRYNKVKILEYFTHKSWKSLPVCSLVWYIWEKEGNVAFLLFIFIKSRGNCSHNTSLYKQTSSFLNLFTFTPEPLLSYKVNVKGFQPFFTFHFYVFETCTMLLAVFLTAFLNNQMVCQCACRLRSLSSLDPPQSLLLSVVLCTVTFISLESQSGTEHTVLHMES